MTAHTTKEKITASEIGQYTFCPLSWHLQKKGYPPDSPALKHGYSSHIKLGTTITQLPVEHHRTQLYTILGIIFLILAIGIILAEVLL